MLALKQSLSLVSSNLLRYNPINDGELKFWLKFNTLVESNEDSSGSVISPPHTTQYNTMVTDDRISRWGGMKGYNAIQISSADKPTWSVYPTAPASERNSLVFDGTQYMDLSATVSIAAGQDFSVVTQVLFTDLTQKAIYGADSSNFFRINDATGFRCKIGGAGNNNFTEASDVITVNKWYTLILVRESGELTLYVNGGVYSDKAWGSTLTDNDGYTINNIGSAADDTNNFEGVLRNVVITDRPLEKPKMRKNIYEYFDQLQG